MLTVFACALLFAVFQSTCIVSFGAVNHICYAPVLTYYVKTTNLMGTIVFQMSLLKTHLQSSCQSGNQSVQFAD